MKAIIIPEGFRAVIRLQTFSAIITALPPLPPPIFEYNITDSDGNTLQNSNGENITGL